MMFGTHAANIGGALAFKAKVEHTVCNMMYPKLSPKPIPKYMPIPPFRFLDDQDERGKAGCDTLMVFHLILYYVTGTTTNLFVDVVVKFRRCECLLLPF